MSLVQKQKKTREKKKRFKKGIRHKISSNIWKSFKVEPNKQRKLNKVNSMTVKSSRCDI